MNTTQIEKNLQKLIKNIASQPPKGGENKIRGEFIYELLLAYGLPKASIKRLRKGNYNLATNSNFDSAQSPFTISWKKKLYYQEVLGENLHTAIIEIEKTIKHNERFIIVTDFETFLAIDTKTKEKLDIDLLDLREYYDFFLPWAGMEKANHQNENPADVKAAEKMAKLFDIIKKDNPSDDSQFIHELNIFLSRLLFCFFAEDIVPVVSSERRSYIPCGFINPDEIVPNSAQIIYDTEPYILGVIMSRIHMSWVKLLAGKRRKDYRYSSTLVYNTFPFPKISKQQKEEITRSVFRIIDEREKHSEKTLAQLYDPDKMPAGLKEAHRLNDIIIERCYRNKPFDSDEERLEYLFKLYEKMVAREKV